MVKDDEFVAAPARHQIARTDDGAQPACDLDQELVAGPVAETVVDLLEVVEVEKHHGQAVARGAVATKGQSKLFLETAAIGQLGDRVEARHPIDFELRIAALGHVLDDQNGALACHAMDSDLEGAIVERFEGNDEIDRIVVAGENGGETDKLRLGENAVADQLPQGRFDMRPDGSLVWAKIEHLEGLVVGQDQTATGPACTGRATCC